MQKTGNNQATTAHRKVKSSTTLNRKYVKKPVKSVDMMVPVKKSRMVKRFNTPLIDSKVNSDDQPITPATSHPLQVTAVSRMQKRAESSPVSKMTAKELKDQAIKKALADAAKNTDNESDNAKDESKNNIKMHFGFGRVVLAISCAAAAVFAIVYFVNLNMPDISMRVAAIQTGIEASYPGYVPKGFNLSGIASENGKVILNFNNSDSGEAFSIIEENSSWDSNALVTNFVKYEYSEDYSIIREQGLTIYVDGSNATWVNGGVLYKLNVVNGFLTKKQIRSIAVSF